MSPVVVQAVTAWVRAAHSVPVRSYLKSSSLRDQERAYPTIFFAHVADSLVPREQRRDPTVRSEGLHNPSDRVAFLTVYRLGQSQASSSRRSGLRPSASRCSKLRKSVIGATMLPDSLPMAPLNAAVNFLHVQGQRFVVQQPDESPGFLRRLYLARKVVVGVFVKMMVKVGSEPTALSQLNFRVGQDLDRVWLRRLGSRRNLHCAMIAVRTGIMIGHYVRQLRSSGRC